MSASNTNLEKQKERHAGPLSGMAILLTLVALMFVGWVGYEFLAGEEPAGAEVQINGLTGEEVEG